MATILIPDLLTTLTDSLISASSSFPASWDSLLPPVDGISLLDTKNDLLLSYLQHLVFLIILRLRNLSGVKEAEGSVPTIGGQAVQQLTEIRAYLEKGVRPLEGRLKYQIEKVLRAAEDAERKQEARAPKGRSATSTKARTKGASPEADESDSESADSEEENPSATSGAHAELDDLSHRPNPTALLTKTHHSSVSNTKPHPTNRSSTAYHPPRITPTSMPPSQPHALKDKPSKSHLLDEYIHTEHTSTPTTLPSIGSNSTILQRGRSALSSRDRNKEHERTEYEERNFARLPRESKAERRKMRDKGLGGGRERYGGEDWGGLGEGRGEWVERAVGGRKGASGRGGVLERREKRRREDGDAALRVNRSSTVGMGIGDSFEKRRKILQARAERKRKPAS